jgi:NapH/MauN family ferredoxin-type protein
MDPFWHVQGVFATGGTGSTVYLGLEKVDPLDPATTLVALSPYLIVGGFLVFALLLGRLFCGWICPYGSFLDFIEKISPYKGRYEMPSELHDKSTKYAILFGALALSMFMGYTAFCDYCPAGVLLKGSAGAALFTAIPVFIIVTLLVFFYGRKAWCSYLCPLGGLLALFTKFHILPIRSTGECIKCLNCEKNCPMDVLVAEEYIQEGKSIRDSECIKCMNCIEDCPKKILRFP